MKGTVALVIAGLLPVAVVGGYTAVTSATCPAPENWPLPELAEKTRKELHEILGPPTDDMFPDKGEHWMWRCGLRVYWLSPDYGGDQVLDAYQRALASRGVGWETETPSFQGLKVVKINVYRADLVRSMSYLNDWGFTKFRHTPATPVRAEQR